MKFQIDTIRTEKMESKGVQIVAFGKDGREIIKVIEAGLSFAKAQLLPKPKKVRVRRSVMPNLPVETAKKLLPRTPAKKPAGDGVTKL